MQQNQIYKNASKFAKKVNYANLKSNVDKLDISKLKNVRTNLSNLKSKVDKVDVDAVKNDVIKNMYIMLR